MSPLPDLPLIFEALRFAAQKHRDQRRKDSRSSPYINHPIAVASELVSAGVRRPDILAAAILHDTIEDTWTTPEELDEAFGPEIRHMVELMTDDKRLPKSERKRLQTEHAAELPADVKQIKIADKIANVVDMCATPPAGWSRRRRIEYLDWTEDVVEGCRGVNPVLDRRYDDVLATAHEMLATAPDAPEGLRCIAVDWSGAKTGARNRIWLAEVQNGTVVRLESGRDRREVIDELIAEARRNPSLIVGFDFAFSFPMWFFRKHLVESARGMWALVEREGEGWLSECPEPFWGRPGHRHPDADALPEPYRATETALPAIGGVRPKSVFQIGGAGAVGTGSIRGMPFLKELVEVGFSAWPFDDLRPPAVVEIYPRALTGEVVKSSSDARAAYLDRLYPDLAADVRGAAADSEDAFDALVSALVMWDQADELRRLRRAADWETRWEGAIWVPGAVPAVAED